ncbi:SagB/ThcOx family dehydrogenase [Kitasatospora sp. NBC_00374]|uniref:SagB/ThcOx family dehydrogenase n=1 Tax=Kitasatospora sp. NBC_00374 TaxID=2975964 RepID=UPI0030E02066
MSDHLSRNSHVATVAAFGQQHTSVSMYSATTVVRAPESVVRGRWNPAVDGFVGEDLLLNHRRSGRDLGMQLGVSRFYGHDAVLSSAHSDLQERLDGAIALPAHRRLRSGLTATVAARRSGRQFSGKPASVEELATVLWHAQGVSGSLPVPTAQDGDAAVALRNAPSGGGLYPVRLAVLAQHVRGMAPGAYEYQPHSHTLFPYQTVRPVELSRQLWTADVELDKVAFALVYVYDLYVNSQKYGDSGLVFALIEVGGISQNVHLARTSLGMIGCDQGGYDKQTLEKTLGCDGTSRHVVHLTLLGHGEA